MHSTWYGNETPKPPKYSEYKAAKFEKTTQKIRTLLRGIEDMSLKESDKVKLLSEIKQIVDSQQPK